MKTGKVYDWHSLRNQDCPQNSEEIEKDCTCKAPVKRERKCGLINRAAVRKALLSRANASQTVRIFTQVSPVTLSEIEALIEANIKARSLNPPKKGKTL